jgi:hypothetical protein
MPTKSESVKQFLQSKTHADLYNLYGLNMECQVNVAQDGGTRIDGDFKGKKWHGWTDGISTWKSFRIPLFANTDPEYTDSEMKWDLEQHAEGIGMTGWDWVNKVSRWVAYDFDAIVGHSEKNLNNLNPEQLSKIIDEAKKLDWVTVRKSTSGKGLHIYVFLDPVKTQNHDEHAALARAILGKMSALTGFDFHNQVDIVGGNMWVWHRKMEGTDGLTLIQQGGKLFDVPMNWMDHLNVVRRTRRKSLPHDISEKQVTPFEELCGRISKVPLDDSHKQLLNYLTEQNHIWWWDQDHHMLVTHTFALLQAHEHLGMRGIFKTTSKGSDLNTQNCFCFPCKRGAWSVRRYGQGIQEDDSWDQDKEGWTRCYLNKEPDFSQACKAFGGIENPTGGFFFRETEVASKAATHLGVTIECDPSLSSRECTLKQHKDGRLIAQIERKPTDQGDKMVGWLATGSKPWTRIFNTPSVEKDEPDSENFDDTLRHIINEINEDCGWVIKSDNQWRQEPLAHVKPALSSMGLSSNEITGVLGSCIFRCWKIVNKPFQPEYTGDREWNRNAAQFRFAPTTSRENLQYPTWTKILQHCGSSLDEAVSKDPWTSSNGILTGAEYLKCWIASMFQEPYEPLPYLFFHGNQNCGKSIFHEALSLLMTKGYARAEAAIMSKEGFNGELEGAILCVAEEIDLRSNQAAYNRIKDFVTSRELPIHPKGCTPYHIPNTTHWCQFGNDYKYCPIFPGDTRITMLYVDNLDPKNIIPKKVMIPMLEKEAPDFMAEILNLELPLSNDRLNIPCLNTDDKSLIQQLNRSAMEAFIDEKCKLVAGRCLKFSNFFDKFQEWLEPNEINKWTKNRVAKELPRLLPKGRQHSDGQFYIGNISWVDDSCDIMFDHPVVLCAGYLEAEYGTVPRSGT